jgi:hypothetical protein
MASRYRLDQSQFCFAEAREAALRPLNNATLTSVAKPFASSWMQSNIKIPVTKRLGDGLGKSHVN